mmetsp:Transcript_13570/g.30117  ORF Transcript_13570/g.30117 Transcript_13570/m.30117 type:complete len:228 (+) Transcript_13570:2231-2914(+)
MLGLLQITLHLVHLCNVLISIRQQILPVLGHQPKHLFILLALLVHIDCQITLLDHNVHLLGDIQLALVLKLLRKVDVQVRPLGFAHVVLRDLVSLLKLVVLDVHLHRQVRFVGAQVGSLCLVKLTGLGVVSSELLVVRGREIWVFGVVQELLGLVPLTGIHCRFDGLLGVPGLDVVVDRCIHLLLRHQPVTPLLLQLHHQCRRLLLRQLNCLSVGVPSAVGIHGLLH